MAGEMHCWYVLSGAYEAIWALPGKMSHAQDIVAQDRDLSITVMPLNSISAQQETKR